MFLINTFQKKYFMRYQVSEYTDSWFKTIPASFYGQSLENFYLLQVHLTLQICEATQELTYEEARFLQI